jgi:hypothetical protein
VEAEATDIKNRIKSTSTTTTAAAGYGTMFFILSYYVIELRIYSMTRAYLGIISSNYAWIEM